MTYKTKNCPTSRDFARKSWGNKRKEFPVWWFIIGVIFSIFLAEGVSFLAITGELTVSGILSFLTLGLL